jgi:hypothetical protein
MLAPVGKITVERCQQFLKQSLEIMSIDEGIQIDRSWKQSQNAPDSRCESFEPESNATSDRPSQIMKQPPEIVSTDAGMQIDSSAEQKQKARSPRVEILLSDSHVQSESFQHPSNLTEASDLHHLKQPAEIRLMALEIVISFWFPKYQISEVAPKSTIKPSQTRRNRFSGSILTCRIVEPARAKPES